MELHIFNTPCWNCKKIIKVALLDGELGPPNFNKETIQIAQQHGVVIEERYSKMGEEKYLANICSSCHQIWGDFFFGVSIMTNQMNEFLFNRIAFY